MERTSSRRGSIFVTTKRYSKAISKPVEPALQCLSISPLDKQAIACPLLEETQTDSFISIEGDDSTLVKVADPSKQGIENDAQDLAEICIDAALYDLAEEVDHEVYLYSIVASKIDSILSEVIENLSIATQNEEQDFAETRIDPEYNEAIDKAAHEDLMHSAVASNIDSILLELLEKEFVSLAACRLLKYVEIETLDELIEQTSHEIFKPILLLNRFKSPVDDYFVCKKCEGVVCDPVQCNSCEELLCRQCVIGLCPTGCPEISVGKMGKFATIIYERLQMECIHKPNGCEFSASIKCLPVHEASCLYKIVHCDNPMCPHTFRKLDRPAANQTCCSDLCGTISQFNRSLMSSDKVSILHKFTELLSQAKSALRHEVELEYSKDYHDLAEKRRELDMIEAERCQVARDLYARRINYHPGKWSAAAKTWSCCKCRDMYVLGCKEFS